MYDDRLPTHLWVMAHIRRCAAEGIPATVAHKGEAMGGMLLVKLNQLDRGCRVLNQSRDIDGRICWMAAFDGGHVPESEADSYIGRAIERDPDLWVVEIEDREGRHPFEGKVL